MGQSRDERKKEKASGRERACPGGGEGWKLLNWVFWNRWSQLNFYEIEEFLQNILRIEAKEAENGKNPSFPMGG